MEWTENLRKRTMAFALAVIRFCRTLPDDVEADVIRRQLLKAGTAVGANYRATCRGRSRKERKAKMGIVIEEADESEYWLLLLDAVNRGDSPQRKALLNEAGELTRIFVTGRSNMPD